MISRWFIGHCLKHILHLTIVDTATTRMHIFPESPAKKYLREHVNGASSLLAVKFYASRRPCYML
jgi:hypothetical protein